MNEPPSVGKSALLAFVILMASLASGATDIPAANKVKATIPKSGTAYTVVLNGKRDFVKNKQDQEAFDKDFEKFSANQRWQMLPQIPTNNFVKASDNQRNEIYAWLEKLMPEENLILEKRLESLEQLQNSLNHKLYSAQLNFIFKLDSGKLAQFKENVTNEITRAKELKSIADKRRQEEKDRQTAQDAFDNDFKTFLANKSWPTLPKKPPSATVSEDQKEQVVTWFKDELSKADIGEPLEERGKRLNDFKTNLNTHANTLTMLAIEGSLEKIREDLKAAFQVMIVLVENQGDADIKVNIDGGITLKPMNKKPENQKTQKITGNTTITAEGEGRKKHDYPVAFVEGGFQKILVNLGVLQHNVSFDNPKKISGVTVYHEDKLLPFKTTITVNHGSRLSFVFKREDHEDIRDSLVIESEMKNLPVPENWKPTDAKTKLDNAEEAFKNNKMENAAQWLAELVRKDETARTDWLKSPELLLASEAGKNGWHALADKVDAHCKKLGESSQNEQHSPDNLRYFQIEKDDLFKNPPPGEKQPLTGTTLEAWVKNWMALRDINISVANGPQDGWEEAKAAWAEWRKGRRLEHFTTRSGNIGVLNTSVATAGKMGEALDKKYEPNQHDWELAKAFFRQAEIYMKLHYDQAPKNKDYDARFETVKGVHKKLKNIFEP